MTIHISLYCRNPRGTEPAAAGADTRRKPGRRPNNPQLSAADPGRRPARDAVDSAVLLQHAALAHRGRTAPSAPGRQIQYLMRRVFKNIKDNKIQFSNTKTCCPFNIVGKKTKIQVSDAESC